MKLYIIHAGFYDADLGIYEMHTNFVVAAESAKAAKEQVKAKAAFVNKKMHVDGIHEINSIDGYRVILEKEATLTDSVLFGYDQSKAL